MKSSILRLPLGSPLGGKGGMAQIDDAAAGQSPATAAGATRLVALHFAVMAGVVALVWQLFFNGPDHLLASDARNFGFGAAVIGLIAAVAGRFRPSLCRYAAPVFAVAGGVFIGGLTVSAEARFPGIAVLTVVVSGAVFCTMLLLHVTRIVVLSDQAKAIILAASGAVGIVYLVSFICLFMGYRVPFIHEAGTGAVLWFGLTAALAAAHLLVDFQRIERLDGAGKAPVAEWHAALAVMTTFVWMYLSILRLLRNLRK